jgi:hypothetical protein
MPSETLGGKLAGLLDEPSFYVMTAAKAAPFWVSSGAAVFNRLCG